MEMDVCSGIKIVVGLGNPGKEYAETRHNLGFRVVDLLAEQMNISVKKKKFSSLFGQLEFGNENIILLKPQQFMNRSGQAVATAVGFYKAKIKNLLVVTDDMAIEPGKIRLRTKGSSGGHNGLVDIIEKLGTNQFARLRVGIGQSGFESASGYVLKKPSKQEQAPLAEAIERAKKAALCWIEYGAEKTMNEFND